MPEKRKVPVAEVFPAAFVDFMKIVDSKIEQRDPDTIIESDDLIQCEHTFGGLVDVAEQTYGFEFMEGENFDSDGFSIAWHYLLNKRQIKEIARHELISLAMWRCSNDCGRRANMPEWYCPQCDFPP
ncbi:MAG: hypothetical protein ABL921_15230 [Pirellula sp.]